jgi:ATP-binding cassette subfamily C protein
MSTPFAQQSAGAGGSARAAGTDLVQRTRRRFLRTLAFAFALTAVCNLVVLLVPLYSMEVFNIVLNTRNTNTLLWLSLGLAIALPVYAAVDLARALLYEAMADRAARTLGLPTLLAAAQVVDDGASSTSGQAVRDLGELKGFVSGNAVSVPLDLFWSPFLLGVLYAMHWAYGAFATLCALTLLMLGLLAEQLTRRPLEQANAETVRSFAEIAVSLRNAEVVQGLGMLPALARRWRRSQDAMLGKLWSGTRTAKAIAATTKACRLLMTGGMVCLGLVLCLNGDVSSGSMVAGNMILAKLLLPFEQLVSSWRAWVSARAAWERLRSLLTETPSQRGTLALPCRSGRVRVERLVYLTRGSERPVLRGVSFDIESGEVLAVIGPSGAGKSTLARLIVGAAEPTAGGVWLDGNSTWRWERGDFGRHVGYMPQTAMLPDGSIAENIARLRDADPCEVVAAARDVGLHDAIMKLPNGYATPIGDAGFILSGGQRQRLALARALFGNPKLLVLDEPNSNLDDDGERMLVEVIDGVRQKGTSVLMITHRPALVAVADKLLVLKDGVIDRFGAREAVMRGLKAPPVQLLRRPQGAAPAQLAAT